MHPWLFSFFALFKGITPYLFQSFKLWKRLSAPLLRSRVVIDFWLNSQKGI